MPTKIALLMTLPFFACFTAAAAGEQESASATTGHAELLQSLVGRWEGTCRTWLRPGKLADESPVKGEIQFILADKVLRHTYESRFQDQPRNGEETIAFNPREGKYQVSWVDTFHMTDGILFSEGEATENGFSVRASYRMSPEQEAWGWRTVFEMHDNDHLTITAYNILPNGPEGKAVETVYQRLK